MALPPISYSIKFRGCLDDRPLLPNKLRSCLDEEPLLPDATTLNWGDDSNNEEIVPSNEVTDETQAQQIEHSDWDRWESIKLATDIQTIIRNINMPTAEEIIDHVRQTTLSPKALKQHLEAQRLNNTTTVSWEDDSSDEEIVAEPAEETRAQQTTLSPEVVNPYLDKDF